MADLRITVSGDVRNLNVSLSKATRSVKNFTSRSKRAFGGLSKTLGGLGKLMGPLGLAGGAAGLSYALIKAGKETIAFDGALTRVAIQSNISTKRQMELRKAIIETAVAQGQSREKIVESLDAIIQRTGDMDLAASNMTLLAKAASATGADMSELGAVLANLGQKFGFDSKEMERFFNILTVQGKKGSFTLKDMASQGERVFAAAQGLDIRSMEDLSFFTGLLQIGRQATGSAEQATTGFENMALEITKKAAQIRKKTGFNVIDLKETRKQGRTVFKDIREVIYGLMEATGGDAQKLTSIFGNRSVRVVRAIANVWAEEGREGIEKFVSVTNNEMSTLDKDRDRYLQSTEGRVKRLSSLFTKFMDSAAGPALEELGDSLETFLSDPQAVKDMADAFMSLGKGMAYAVKMAGKLAAMGNKFLSDQASARAMLKVKIPMLVEQGILTKGEAAKITAMSYTKTKPGKYLQEQVAAAESRYLGKQSGMNAVLEAALQTGKRPSDPELGAQYDAMQARRAGRAQASYSFGDTPVKVEVINYIGGQKAQSERTVTTTKRGDKREVLQGTGG